MNDITTITPNFGTQGFKISEGFMDMPLFGSEAMAFEDDIDKDQDEAE